MWAIARKGWRSNIRDYIIPTSGEINRKDAIERFVKLFPKKTWPELRMQGFYAIKVEMVPIGGRP
jgi:hypothetical protein